MANDEGKLAVVGKYMTVEEQRDRIEKYVDAFLRAGLPKGVRFVLVTIGDDGHAIYSNASEAEAGRVRDALVPK